MYILYVSVLMKTAGIASTVQQQQQQQQHRFNGPLSGTTRVNLYQKGKNYLDFNEVRDSRWQWHQLGHDTSP